MEKPRTAFALALVAGIFVLLNSLLLAAAGSLISFVMENDLLRDMLKAIVSVYAPTAQPLDSAGLAIAQTVLILMAGIAAVFGIIIVISALMLRRNPKHKLAYGILILVFSIISILVGGGFIIGLILGVLGGALALVWKPKSPSSKTNSRPA